MVEQRYQAVLAVICDGVPVVEVASRFGVSRQAVHRWLRWYEDQGLAGLADRSHRPPRCSHQMDPAIEGKVFTGRFGLHDTEVLFDRICRENGIDHLLTAPRGPTTTGKIERFHRTLRSEFLTGRTFADLVSAGHSASHTWRR